MIVDSPKAECNDEQTVRFVECASSFAFFEDV